MKLLIELDEEYIKVIDKIKFLVGGRTDRKLQLKIIKAIKNGKALEQEPRWISTAERLPKEDGEYLVTIYDMDEDNEYMDIAELENGIWQYKNYIKVLAWMSLPKLYKGKGEI